MKKKPLTPAMQNPYVDMPEWQKYLREKQAEMPQYHKDLLDEIEPNKQRRGAKVEMFVLIALITMVWWFARLMYLRIRTSQDTVMKDMDAFSKLHNKLLLGDEFLIRTMVSQIDSIRAVPEYGFFL